MEERRVGLVFQDYALLSLSVEANVGFGVDDDARVAELLAQAGLSAHATRWPELSGKSSSELRRCALAPRPSVLLMDELFANLDAVRRQTIGAAVKRALNDSGTAALFVTHDRADALYLADRVVLVPVLRAALWGRSVSHKTCTTDPSVWTSPDSLATSPTSSLDGGSRRNHRGVDNRVGGSFAGGCRIDGGSGSGIVVSRGFLGCAWRTEVRVGAGIWCDHPDALAVGQTVDVRLQRAHAVAS